MLTACGEVTIVVDKLPEGTGADKVYLAGNFNFWDPADSRYQLEKREDGSYAVTLPVGWGTVDCKFTRGDWTTVEVNSCGDPIPNRIIDLANQSEIKMAIESWKDIGTRNCQKVNIKVRPIKPLKPGERIHIAGNFNNWTADDPVYELKPAASGYYTIDLTKGESIIEYKFTRGSWEAEELNEYGRVIQNRVFVFGSTDSLELSIPFWKDRCRTGGHEIIVKLLVPPGTPERQRVFVSGNFNGWISDSPSHELKRHSDGSYVGRFNLVDPTGVQPTEFKFTRGSWATVECEPSGRRMENRMVTMGVRDTITLSVKAWLDMVKHQ